MDADDAFIEAAFDAWLQDALRSAHRWNRYSFDAAWRLAFQQLRQRLPHGFDPQAQVFIQRFHIQSLRRVSRDGLDRVRASLLESLRDGVGTQEAARRLRDVLDAGTSRLELIARTETNRAANWGRLSGYQQSGVVQSKEWIATHDDRVREDHLAADGDTVPLDATFTRGAADGLMAPPAAPNCRCTIAPVTGLFTGLNAGKQARPAFEKEFPFAKAAADHHALELQRAWAQLVRILVVRL